jgi:hypothetical protein
MADEDISFRAMVNHEVGPVAYMTHSADFGLCGDRTSNHSIADHRGRFVTQFVPNVRKPGHRRRPSPSDLEGAGSCARFSLE